MIIIIHKFLGFRNRLIPLLLFSSLAGSQIAKAWRTTMEELDQSAKQLRMNADLLEGLCQDRLAQLFQDKRKARKAYQEEHSKIAAQFNNVSASSIIFKIDELSHCLAHYMISSGRLVLPSVRGAYSVATIVAYQIIAPSSFRHNVYKWV